MRIAPMIFVLIAASIAGLWKEPNKFVGQPNSLSLAKIDK